MKPETLAPKAQPNGLASLKMGARKAIANLLYRTGGLTLFERGITPPWRIITYHRVTTPESEPYPLQPGMYVRPESFAAQMEYLANECHVIPLEQLVTALKEGQSLPRRTVVITFDDGWIDTYTNAFPILSRLNLPATVFLATAYVDSPDLFWSDRLAYSLVALNREQRHRDRVTSRLLASDAIPPNIRNILIDIFGTPEPQPGAEQQRHERIARKIDECVEALKDAAPVYRQSVVEMLWGFTRESSSRWIGRMFVSWEQVAEMAAAGIAFGSHSHNHHRMTELHSAQLSDEIVTSLHELREHRLKASSVFCYPGGYHDAETQKALRKESVSHAVLATPGSALGSNPVLLGRTNIHEDVTSTVPLFAFRIWTSSLAGPTLSAVSDSSS